ncbi:dihydrofolate reductase-like [Teratosphaeria destructans]|uniref:Dihydrofolate reductase n=1 Tax=Teratosphaeria destructans TaxID=418781 RepID=A0A9W7SKC1_9PEZI|nr:dihydrofolate reductase-like [Teratosphaeria destructans]
MADEMSLKQIPLTIIVAATPKNGIGNNGGLPWPMLKKEMAYFARVTKRVPMPVGTGSAQSDAWKQTNLEGTRRNVVIMGRKTWESIPPKFRPLKDRTNIIISTQDRSKLGGVPDDVVVASNISSGLEALEQHVKDGKALPVGRAFVIGGSSVYEAAFKLPQTKSVLLTRIKKDFDCDTQFPEDVGAASSSWQQSSREGLERFVGEAVPAEGLTEGEGQQSISYEFHLYERP